MKLLSFLCTAIICLNANATTFQRQIDVNIMHRTILSLAIITTPEQQNFPAQASKKDRRIKNSQRNRYPVAKNPKTYSKKTSKDNPRRH